MDLALSTIDITVSCSGGSEMQLALYSAAEDEPHHNQRTHGADDVKTFGETYSHSDFAPKLSEIILTKKGKNDTCIPPSILIEHVQWRYIFFTDLFSFIRLVVFCFDTDIQKSSLPCTGNIYKLGCR
jgi:hypothetical protein